MSSGQEHSHPVIDLVARDDRSGYGIACALDIERIPYRRIVRAEAFDARLLVVSTPEVSPEFVELARRVPTLIVGDGGPLGTALFGSAVRPAPSGPVVLPLGEPIWSPGVRELAREFGADRLSLASASALVAALPPAARVDASWTASDGRRLPAVVAAGSAHWCSIDLGSALTDLFDERAQHATPARMRVLPRWFLALYYRAPERLRAALQRRVYRRLRLPEDASAYPVDATGWLLLELLKTLLDRAAGGLVRLGRWPAPFASAAALTHDLEPSRFAYTKGLARLLDRVARGGVPATFGVVSRPAARYLRSPLSVRLAAHDVLCHGLEHRGETLGGGARGLEVARRGVEASLGKPAAGFRSPRLDRSPALLRALDASGFRYDSSYPDVDRENDHSFGGGVRLNVPYRPPVEKSGGLAPSRCLELPVSAPDCIQPLFAGENVRALAGAVRRKTAFTRATGGLYVGSTASAPT
jgi:peptidoglycan/xylan/chitin deacetylase (PgdA/CDA1 family)